MSMAEKYLNLRQKYREVSSEPKPPYRGPSAKVTFDDHSTLFCSIDKRYSNANQTVIQIDGMAWLIGNDRIIGIQEHAE